MRVEHREGRTGPRGQELVVAACLEADHASFMSPAPIRVTQRGQIHHGAPAVNGMLRRVPRLQRSRR